MTTLAEFLLARIAEDERHALTAKGDTSGVWGSWNHRGRVLGLRDLACDNTRIAELPGTIDEHIATHSPARVLAECEAKRRIIERIGHHADHDASDSLINETTYASDVVRLLATVYADHPDYREEWRSTSDSQAQHAE